jgi:hypothetical protein
MLVIFLKAIVIIIAIMFISGVVYLISKGKIFKLFYHDILEWHLPDDKPQKFDGCSFHAHCKLCGKEIMQDSQGNWF